MGKRVLGLGRIEELNVGFRVKELMPRYYDKETYHVLYSGNRGYNQVMTYYPPANTVADKASVS